ncbi:MAG: hypothetical protein V3U27_20425, partial [Candidatus Tectomicrobia bacterium]
DAMNNDVGLVLGALRHRVPPAVRCNTGDENCSRVSSNVMSGSPGKNLCVISFYDAGFYTGRQGFFTTGIVSNIVMYDGIARTSQHGI